MSIKSSKGLLGKQINSLVGVIIFLFALAVGIYIITLIREPSKSIETLVEKEQNNNFFLVKYVGFYNNKNFGEIPNGCIKNSDSKYSCNAGSVTGFYVGIENKGNKKRYFYAAPCVIKDYKKGSKCEDDNYLKSQRPCGVDGNNIGECVLGYDFTFEKGNYRIFPAAICPEDCYDPENPSSTQYVVNYDSFLDVNVK
ncbi:MAG: hypothetical protein QXK76_00780 [Candidatus Woesearchaeota archaeon]